MKRLIVAGLLLIWAASGFAAEYTKEAFSARQQECKSSDDLITLCKEFVDQSEDVEVLRSVQDAWMQADKPEAAKYFKGKLKSKGKSALFNYLYGRTLEDPLEQIKVGRKVVSLDPNWPYGYRLLAATYQGALKEEGEDSPLSRELLGMLKEDANCFEALVDLSPKEIMAYSFLLNYQLFTCDFVGAEKTVERGSLVNPNWPPMQSKLAVLVGNGQMDEATKLLEADFDQAVAAGDMDAADKGANVRSAIYMALLQDKMPEKVPVLMKALADSVRRWEDYYFLAAAQARQKQKDAAFASLDKAVKAGMEDAEMFSEAPYFADFKTDARFPKVVDAISANWKAGAVKRKAEALATKLDKPAPDWTLPDKDGNPVKLSSLRGQVVILDFWATWCGPCRMAMPVISKFVAEQKPAGVRVFSVNTWERGSSDKAIAFMAEHKYGMEFLAGNQDVAKAYGITGIPYICAIDKQGMIRYEEKGYDPSLAEKLPWWCEELGK